MKNRFFSILLLLCIVALLDVKAQSADHNYIVKSSFRSMERRFIWYARHELSLMGASP